MSMTSMAFPAKTTQHNTKSKQEPNHNTNSLFLDIGLFLAIFTLTNDYSYVGYVTWPHWFFYSSHISFYTRPGVFFRFLFPVVPTFRVRCWSL